MDVQQIVFGNQSSVGWYTHTPYVCVCAWAIALRKKVVIYEQCHRQWDVRRQTINRQRAEKQTRDDTFDDEARVRVTNFGATTRLPTYLPRVQNKTDRTCVIFPTSKCVCNNSSPPGTIFFDRLDVNNRRLAVCRKMKV